jgi:hypothetical protein
MTKAKSDLTRRKFVLAGSTAVAAPLLMNAAGVATAETCEKKPAKNENYTIGKKMEYDLVIIGGGLSGLVAAARAAELGIKKIGLFEKGKIFGGNGLHCNTFVSSDFADFGDYKTDTNQIGLYRRAMTTLKQTGDPDLIQRYLFASKRVTKWLEDRKLNEKWTAVPAGHPEFTSNYSRNAESKEKDITLGAQVCKAMITECKTRSNLEMHLNSPAVKLLTNAKGEVRGAVVKLEGGEYAEVSAKRLILATGGVGGTNAALSKWMPKYMSINDYMHFGGTSTCSGDGIDMAEEIGAEVGKDMNIHLLGPSYAGGRGPGVGSIADNAKALILSKRGERVMDETYSRDAGQPVCNRVPGKVLYILAGSNSIQTLLSGSSGGQSPPGGPESPAVALGTQPTQGGEGAPGGGQGAPGGQGGAQGMPQMQGGQGGAQGMPQMQGGEGGPGGKAEVVAVADIPTKYAADIKKGALCIAKNLDEAAKFIGCDVNTLKATLDRYEAACKAGNDSQMLKSKENLLSPGGPPYYILWSVRSMDSTQGGITTNKDLHAVTPEGKPINGMFVVGDHVTGFVTSDYYGPGGAGFSFAMISGFLSAEDAAKAV